MRRKIQRFKTLSRSLKIRRTRREGKERKKEIKKMDANEIYRGCDKSLARPGRKQATATEDFDFHISYL